MTRHLVAVLLEDGSLLAIGVDEDPTETLDAAYADRRRAGDLIALGDLRHVGASVTDCIASDDPGAAVHLAGDWDLEMHRSQGFGHLHVFRDGAWHHESDAWLRKDRP